MELVQNPSQQAPNTCANPAQENQNEVQLNAWQRIYRFLMFGLLCSVIVFDIIYIYEVTDQEKQFDIFDYSNFAISFLVIPFILSTINNLRTIKQTTKEAEAFNCFFGFFYKLFRLIGFEHFIINLFTPFMRRSSVQLEEKLVIANVQHALYGSQILLWSYSFFILRHFFDGVQDPSYAIVTPIVLHACHLALLGAEFRQANKGAFLSFVHTFFHIDFFQNLFEGIGRALMIGSTGIIAFTVKQSIKDGIISIDLDIYGGYFNYLVTYCFATEAIIGASLSFLTIIYILIKTGFISGIFYGITMFFSCLGFRADSNYMKLYNNFQRRLSNSVSDSQLRFQYYFPLVWRFLEIIAIYAAILRVNDGVITDKLAGSNSRHNIQSIFIFGLVLNATYLATLLIEFFLYCYMKSKFNATQNESMKGKEKVVVTEEQQLNKEKQAAVPQEPASKRLPKYIDEEAVDFEQRQSQI